MFNNFPIASGPTVIIKKNPKVGIKGHPVPFFEKALENVAITAKNTAATTLRRFS
jgi:hypothetical protein